MIERGKNNLLNADAEALVNTVNCVGVMGKGIALQFKQAYPDNYKQYKRKCDAGNMRLGEVLVVPTGRMDNPAYIINFPTKYHWKEKSRIENIKSGLDALIKEVRQRGIQSIAVPPLGCGNGGLDWAEVKPLIEAAFAELPDVHVLLFEPDNAPAAASMPVATPSPNMTRGRALLIKLLAQYRQGGYKSTLLEIQKLLYFLQEAGEPLKLAYTRNKYGPYAENVNFVLQHINGWFIKGYSDRSSPSEIYVIGDAVDKATEALVNETDAEKRLRQVNNLIEGFETPYGMELLATVHWVAKEYPEAAHDVTLAINKVQEWSQRKQELFTPEHITKAWERLREEGWLTTANAMPS